MFRLLALFSIIGFFLVLALALVPLAVYGFSVAVILGGMAYAYYLATGRLPGGLTFERREFRITREDGGTRKTREWSISNERRDD